MARTLILIKKKKKTQALDFGGESVLFKRKEPYYLKSKMIRIELNNIHHYRTMKRMMERNKTIIVVSGDHSLNDKHRNVFNLLSFNDIEISSLNLINIYVRDFSFFFSDHLMNQRERERERI
ncbi:zinc finger protein [Sarcoptes scabiei]|nr:zinc finger protein [Sarcoptes scabiei]